MNITEIVLPKSYTSRRHGKRCQRKVKSYGTSYFNKDISRCGRLARFTVDGICLCTQHAGDAALKHIIDSALIGDKDE